MRLWRSPQLMLAALSGVFLLLSLIPGAQFFAYGAILAGAVTAIPATWETLKERKIDVEFLMLLSAAGSIAIGRPVEAGILMFLFSLSKGLEDLTLAKTKAAIEGLVKLRPTTARVIRAGEESVVPIESVALDDLVVIPPFELIPTDGVVETGRGSVDNAALTGESVPVSVSEGDRVLAGGRNLEFGLVIRATAISAESTLQKVMNLVEDAQEKKASGERISAWFGQTYTLGVLGISILVLVVKLLLHVEFKDALYQSLTLLVALSPCALVISVPAATLSALAWSASKGVLIRGGEYIERAGLVDTLVLDKTGTLTAGRPELAEICVCSYSAVAAGPSCAEADVCWSGGPTMTDEARRFLAAAAGAEGQSDHPVAKAIRSAVKQFEIPVSVATDFRTLPGLGVTAEVGGSTVTLGQPKMFEGRLEPSFLHHVTEIQSQGMTVAVIELDGSFAALGFRDLPRPEAASLVNTVKEAGVKEVWMFTGDNANTASVVAREVGVTGFVADMLPQDKATRVAALSQAEGGKKVMMVGDGINDAPALAQSYLGVAMGGLGSDIAMNAADVVLMHDRLDMIPALIRLGKKTNSIIRFNLALGGGVIAVLTLGALIGVLPLPLAVVGHEGSTLLVILNGLRLLRGVPITEIRPRV